MIFCQILPVFSATIKPQLIGDQVTTKAAPADAKLIYGGGPVISRIAIYPIFYGNVTNSAQIVLYYRNVVNSTYYDWLSEYNTPNQKIVRGTVNSPIFIKTNIKSNISDADDLRPLLDDLVAKGTIKPNANAYFPIHLAPNINITAGPYKSCINICGYHSSANGGNGNPLYFGVMPDLNTGACRCKIKLILAGCGGGTRLSVFQNIGIVSTHELFETVTDPNVINGWIDPKYGEISDICSRQFGLITSGNGNRIYVQKQYSNEKKDCILVK